MYYDELCRGIETWASMLQSIFDLSPRLQKVGNGKIATHWMNHNKIVIQTFYFLCLKKCSFVYSFRVLLVKALDVEFGRQDGEFGFFSCVVWLLCWKDG